MSLGTSVVEVCVNPGDPWNWAGLIGDAIDLIPFVTGAGEATRAVKTANKVADKTTAVIKIQKAVDFTPESAKILSFKQCHLYSLADYLIKCRILPCPA